MGGLNLERIKTKYLKLNCNLNLQFNYHVDYLVNKFSTKIMSLESHMVELIMVSTTQIMFKFDIIYFQNNL